VRQYRGRDIFYWLDRLGDLERRIDDCADPDAAPRTPPFTLSGVNGGEQLDLRVLHPPRGTLPRRLPGLRGARALFARDLQESVGDADRRLSQLLGRIDDHIHDTRPDRPDDDRRPEPVRIDRPPASIDLDSRGIATVIWATGYRRTYPWLHV